MTLRKRTKSESDDEYSNSRKLRKKPALALSAKMAESESSEDESDIEVVSENPIKHKSQPGKQGRPKVTREETTDYPLLTIPKNGSRYDKVRNCFIKTTKSLPKAETIGDLEQQRAYAKCFELAKYLNEGHEYQAKMYKAASATRGAATTKLKNTNVEIEALQKSKVELGKRVTELETTISTLRSIDKGATGGESQGILQQNREKDAEIARLHDSLVQARNAIKAKQEQDLKEKLTEATTAESVSALRSSLEASINAELARTVEVESLKAELAEAKEVQTRLENEKAAAEEKAKSYEDRLNSFFRSFAMPVSKVE